MSESFYENKLQTKSNFLDGKHHGLYEFFVIETGLHLSKEYFKNGEEHGTHEFFHDSGKIKTRTYFKEGKKEGTEEHYDENGLLEMKSEYKNDLQHGISEIFYSSFHDLSPTDVGYGKLYSKGQYKEDRKIGIWEWYDKEGKVVRRDGEG